MTVRVPYKLYKEQIQILDDLKAWWKGGKKHMLLQAPTGTGKTLVHLIFGILKLEKHRLIYFSREHAQIEQCTLELRQLIEKNQGKDIKAVHIAGRGVSCIQPDVMILDDHEEQLVTCESYNARICDYHTQLQIGKQVIVRTDHQLTLLPEHRYVYYQYDIEKEHNTRVAPGMVTQTPLSHIVTELFADGIATNEKILEIAGKYIICPRKLQNLAMDYANIIFAPYNYMVIPRFPQSEEQQGTDFFIIDESHNLDTNLTSMLSVEIGFKTVERYFTAVNETVKYEYLKDLSNKVIPKITALKKENLLLSGDKLKIVMDTIEYEDAKVLGEMITKEVNSAVREKRFGKSDSEGKKVPKAFLSMRKFTDAILRLKRNHYSGIIDTEDDRYKVLFVDTDVIFSSISARAHRILISSGSLYPRFMGKYLGLKKDNTIMHDYNPPHRNRFGVGQVINRKDTVRLNTSYDNRSAELYQAYAKIVWDGYKMNKAGTLVYFTSYKFRNEIGGYLEQWGVPYYEPQTIEAYRAEISAGKRAIFMSAFRGLGSEGWNLGDDQSRLILLCGIPYLPHKEPIVMTQKNYYEKKRIGLGQSWYNQKAALWLMQSFGRGIRHKNDWTKVYFLDDRVARLKRYFIKWVDKATNWKPRNWDEIKNARPRISEGRRNQVS